jgi:aspartate carbamoyltransferase catalytic subunit
MDAGGQDERAKVGLCGDCRHGRRVESDRGSVFWRCELSVSDPSFPKYPRLPVRECRGYEAEARNVDERISGAE